MAVLDTRPLPGEHAPYFAQYIGRVPDGDLLRQLAGQVERTAALVEGAEERAGFRYAPGKWSVREVIGHLADTERVLAYRALAASRGDTTELPRFDENAWVERANFEQRTLADLLAELRAVRAATVAFFGSLDDGMLLRRGVTPSGEFTVRALGWVIAGHELHHVAILKERYGLRGTE